MGSSVRNELDVLISLFTRACELDRVQPAEDMMKTVSMWLEYGGASREETLAWVGALRDAVTKRCAPELQEQIRGSLTHLTCYYHYAITPTPDLGCRNW